MKAHFGDLVKGTVQRYEAPNVMALKFVMQDALGGGAPRSLRADNLGKTFGAALLRMWIDVPDEVAAERAGATRPSHPFFEARNAPYRVGASKNRRGSSSEAPEVTEHGGKRIEERVDVGVGARPPDGDAQRTLGVEAHRLEDWRRLEGFGRTRAAGMRGDARSVETEEHRLRLHSEHAEAHDVRHAVRRIAVDNHAIELSDAGEHPVSEPSCGRRLNRQPVAGQQFGRRRAEPDECRHVLHARPAGPLLIPSQQQRTQPQAAADKQHAGPRRCAELVAADREEVGAELVERDGHVAGGLRGVDMDEHAPVAAGRHDVGHRLDRADLVIAPLHVDRAGVRADRVEHIVRRTDRAGRPPRRWRVPMRATASRTQECSTADTT